ncbi:MAG: FixH family protein [Trueperaceae bacterium]|nr:FixH family protein [Trueperaceae bacterium]
MNSKLKPVFLIFLLSLSFIGGVSQTALAHATIVLGKLYSEPATPAAGESFSLRLEMVDPSQIPIEDAVVLADFKKNGQSEVTQVTFSETSPGTYETTAELNDAGEYTLLMRDQTFRQEEARATLSFFVGEASNETPIAFVFPPTATGSNNLLTWLIWLIAVPVVAGIVVTVIVLMNSKKADADDD